MKTKVQINKEIEILKKKVNYKLNDEYYLKILKEINTHNQNFYNMYTKK